MPNGSSPGPGFGKSLFYTVLGLLAVAAAVSAVMYFLTCRMGEPVAFWLIPIFGAAGGVVGSLRSDGKIYLLSWQGPVSLPASPTDPPALKPSSLQTGLVGDVVIGLAGATAVSFLLGGTLNLKYRAFDADPQGCLVLIAVSLIAGAFGQKVVELAGTKLLAKEAKDEARAATATAVGAHNAINAELNTRYAEDNLARDLDLDKALKSVEEALDLDAGYVHAYVVKAEVLKVKGEKMLKENNRDEHDAYVRKAITVLDDALKLASKVEDKSDAYYDRARFKARINIKVEDVIADLKEAIDLNPKLSVAAFRNLYGDWAGYLAKPDVLRVLREGAQKAIKKDETFLDAYVVEAWALKRENQIQHAYDALNKALSGYCQGKSKFTDDAMRPAAYYNRACYAALRGLNLEHRILPDLRNAITLSPRLACVAAKDDDFHKISENLEFKHLLDSFWVESDVPANDGK